MRLSQRLERTLRKLKEWFRRNPKSPCDSYAYVMAPKKPRRPQPGAATVAELPEKS